MATSPGTYPVSRENPPIPYLPSTELEPPVDQATSVWNISMAANKNISGNCSSGNPD
ncbi:unnamed protein product, partial [Larinioides sclopetarius]